MKGAEARQSRTGHFYPILRLEMKWLKNVLREIEKIFQMRLYRKIRVNMKVRPEDAGDSNSLSIRVTLLLDDTVGQNDLYQKASADITPQKVD